MTDDRRLQTELESLESRRLHLLDRRISVSSLGGDDLGGGMRSEQWRDLNQRIDAAGDLARVEARIAELQRLLADASSEPGIR